MIEFVSSRQNPVVQHFRKLLSSRAYREKAGEFVCDGRKMLREAITWNGELCTVLFTKESEPELPESVRRVCVSPELMSYVSKMESPQGILFSCRIPKPEPLRVCNGSLVLDGIQDPGNLGTILRTADAFSIPLILSDGCADLYNPKTVSAGMGAVFRAKVCHGGKAEILSLCRREKLPIYATALSRRAVDLRKAELHGVFVIGSEGSGVCSAYLDAAEGEIIIPMSERCESLNAATAAAILMWEIAKQSQK